jgi:GNAT superfamily N-acetyltransferase
MWRAIEAYAISLGRPPNPASEEAEWLGELHPELREVPSVRFPVLANVGAASRLDGAELLTADDPRLGVVIGAMGAGFASSDRVQAQEVLDRRDRIRAGTLVVAGAFIDGRAVGGALATPVGGVAEISGIAVIPSARGRGLGAVLMSALLDSADLVFTVATSPGAVAAARAAGLADLATACFPAPGTLRRLGPEDWRAYREIRLRALTDSPDSFSATHAGALAMPETQWRERLVGPSPVWAVFEAGHPVSMGGGFPAPDGATAQVVGMWTAPEARGRGYARLLLREIIAWTTAAGRTAYLQVTEGNAAARALYVECGFVPTGERSPLREGSDLRVEEFVLTRA